VGTLALQQFSGMLFTLRLKPKIFNKLMNGEMQKKDISEENFASFDEMESNFIFVFFAMNKNVSSLLFIQFYIYSIT